MIRDRSAVVYVEISTQTNKQTKNSSCVQREFGIWTPNKSSRSPSGRSTAELRTDSNVCAPLLRCLDNSGSDEKSFHSRCLVGDFF